MDSDIGQTVQHADARLPTTGEAVLWLSGMAYWRVVELDYGEPTNETYSRVLQIATDSARAWMTAPGRSNPAQVFQTLINGFATADDLSALAAAFKMVREGHLLYHAAIRHQQRLALQEAFRVRGIAALRPTLEGIHRLLYEPHEAFGLESWQFAGALSEGTFRLLLPEPLGLVADLRGRDWLAALMSAYARVDEASVSARLAEHIRSLVDLLNYELDGHRLRVTRTRRREREPKTILLPEHVLDSMVRADVSEDAQDEQPADSPDPVERWKKLLSDAGPTQHRLLDAWLKAQYGDPDRADAVPLSAIARHCGITPEAADQAIRRLRRRSS